MQVLLLSQRSFIIILVKKIPSYSPSVVFSIDLSTNRQNYCGITLSGVTKMISNSRCCSSKFQLVHKLIYVHKLLTTRKNCPRGHNHQ